MSRDVSSARTAVWARALLVGVLVALALVVLLPSDDHAALGLVASLAEWFGRFGVPYRFAFPVLEFAANVALFVPVGVLLPLALDMPILVRMVWITAGLGLALSAAIEWSQQWIPGRVSDPRDLVANTLGAAIGAVILFGLRRWITTQRDRQNSHS